MGTLGKAPGTRGIRRRQRGADRDADPAGASHIYTTAMPPALAEAARASLRIAADEEWRRERLLGLVQRLRHGAQRIGLDLMPSQTPIQPLLLGDSDRAMRWSGRCSARGSWSARSVRRRCPRVWRACGSPYRRHTAAQVDVLLEVLAEIAAEEAR